MLVDSTRWQTTVLEISLANATVLASNNVLHHAKFSPSGMLSLTVCNPALLGKFAEGEEYYLDFTKAG